MKWFGVLTVIVALVSSSGAATAQSSSDERAMQLARDRNACDDRRIISARFEDEAETKLVVRCENETFFVGGAGIAGLAALALLAAAGGGAGDGAGDGGGSTPNTSR